ncbi:flagellar export protein FliJ [Clostridium sp. cel8]|jgi:flagellar protein FliJ|uniref:flagellar export protein FliJ n=1 Tax=unclassified Clostridium TaxID=2614128 RepID=UPI0015F42709|nr:flagellar export protein FliJ [Clostridium sp. cel8]MBA5851030.1 flagellar export protein FliJ [Clostridium sp. cel8]
MKKYKFRLQKLLDMRIDREQESIMEFQKVRRESLKLEEKLDDLNKSYNKYKDISKINGVAEQKMARMYINTLVNSIDKTKKELVSKKKLLELKRKELKNRKIERKTVDILKERGRASFIKEENRLEQKSNDEFALYGFIRMRREGYK